MMLVCALVLTPISLAQAEEYEQVANGAQSTANVLQPVIDAASAQMIGQGIDSEWQAIGLARAGKVVPKTYEQAYLEHLQDQVLTKSGKGRMKITDVERLAIAAVAIGKDPTNIDGKGFNLIEKIYNSESWTTGADSLTFQGNNGIIFALIALDSQAFEVPKTAKWTREKLVAELLKYQKAEGAWSLSTSTTGAASYDITAMALTALAPYREQPAVKVAIDKAVTFLSKEQGPTGGFNEAFVGGISSEATSQVIIGLTANAIDPRGAQFTKNGTNLVDHLLGFRTQDGGFKHTIEDKQSNGMATEQALQALVAVELYTKGAGSLYHFGKNPVKPDPNPIPFLDVKGHWAIDFIRQATEAGIIKGYPDGSFKPDAHLTRAQAISIIVRALDLKGEATSPFTDIGGYAKETQAEIAAAYQHGLVVNQNGKFMPGNKVTRAQIALMLARAYDYKTGGKYNASIKVPYSDIGSLDSEAVNAVLMLYELDIATGANGKYNPGNPTTRAQAAKMLVNFFDEVK